MIEVLCALSKEEEIIIENIYEYRCLNNEQINDILKTENNCINTLLEKEVIEEISYKSDLRAYFLTSLGVKLYRQIKGIASEEFDLEKGKVRKGYMTAGQLKMNPVYINHQVHTNQFLLDFREEIGSSVNYDFVNEKEFARLYGDMRPDGVIRIGNVDLFIETDMGTESSKQLEGKWDNYRTFLNSQTFNYMERKIIVLFIVNGVAKVDKRSYLIRKTIYDNIIDKIDDKFEIYVGSHEQILGCCENVIIPKVKNGEIIYDNISNLLYQKHGITSDIGIKVQKFFDETNYLAYSRILDENKNVRIINNKQQIYVIDDYNYEPMSVVKKMSYFEKNSNYFKNKTNKKINYIVIVNNVHQLFNDLIVFSLFDIRNVYFTTYERLNTLPFYKALFTISRSGSVFTFTNYGLGETVFEENIK